VSATATPAPPRRPSPDPAAPLVRARGLTVDLGGRRVLDGLDLDVRPGTVHALLGPNGAGKTTTVRVLTTLLRPDAGVATVAGHDVVKDPEGVRRAIGLSGQYAAVDEHLSGHENLTMFGRLYGLSRPDARARADELLRRFRLDDVGPRRAGTYSGGMRRRLDLAGALVARPSVVVLDEPTTGLDPRSRLEMWDVISELLDDGVAVLLTTQYLEEADRLADTITVIDGGRVIARGTAEHLKRRVGGSRLELTMADRAGLEAAREALRAVGLNDPDVNPDALRAAVAIDGGNHTMLDALRRLHDRGVGAEDFALTTSTLDDVFLSLTGRSPEEAVAEPEALQDRVAVAPDAPRPAETPPAVVTDDDHGRGPAAVAGVRSALRDGAILCGRNLRHVVRIPGRVVTGLVQPVMFVLLFAYVFGGSLGGAAYREFLVAGIIAQTMVFNSSFTTVGLANDLQRGIVERFRSLPISPLALILGRTTADMVVGAVTLLVVSLCGLAIGWAPTTGVLDVVAAYGLALLFGFAMAWIGATVGLLARSVEVAQSAGLIWLFPVSLVSSAFVSVEGMPGVLRTIAEWNPVSAVAHALRELFGNPVPASLPQPDGWPAQNAVLYAVLSSVVILAVFLPIAMRRYRHLTAG